MKYISSIILFVSVIFMLACDKISEPYMNPVEIDADSIKRVLCEEGTASKCTNCPKGACTLERLMEEYPENFIPIAIHSNIMGLDSMYNPAFDGFLPYTEYGIPCVVIDRKKTSNKVYPADFDNVKARFVEAMKTVPAVSMNVENVKWEPSTRKLSYDIKAKVLTFFKGDFRMNSVLTEDSVHGTTSQWNQANFYAGSSQEMCGFEDLPNPIPAAQMYYHHVARHIFDGWNGAEGSVPENNLVGDSIVKSYSYTIPTRWNIKQINIIGFMVNGSDGSIVNACEKEHVGKKE